MRSSILRGWRQTFLLPQRFSPPEREAEFLAHYCKRYGEVRFSSSAIGVLTWIAYLGLDLLLCQLDPAFAAASGKLLAIHGTGTVFLVIYYSLACLSRRFVSDEAYASRVILFGSICVALFILIKQSLAPFPYEYIYYLVGTIVLLIFCFGLYRLRARDVVVLMTIVTVLQLGMLWYRSTSGLLPDELQAHQAYASLGGAFMITIALIGYGIGIQLEHAERQTFTNETDLQRINGALLRRNAEVEQLKADSEQHLRALVEAQARLRAEAEKSNLDKSRFLANAVHDLRQPLQAISNALHPAAIAAGNDDRDKALQLVQLAQAAADTMRKQLSAVLDLSRLESGLIRAEITDFELTTLIGDVMAQQIQVARESQVALHCRLEPGLRIYVRSDRAFLERILLNLIGNGIKYRDPSRSDNVVAIHLTNDAQTAGLSVVDNGLGIAEEHIRSGAIFEPFFQANNRHPEGEKGVGLGLSIIQAMLALLPGHAIKVRSAIGEGSSFSLTLPVSESPPACEAVRQALPGEAQTSLQNCYVILVEDDALVRHSTLALLDALNVRHDAYDSYESFVAGAAKLERIPDVVLSDYRLPDNRTAIDVIEHARALFPSIGALVFSGEMGLAEATAGLPDVVFLCKPLPPEELLQAIASVRPAIA